MVRFPTPLFRKPQRYGATRPSKATLRAKRAHAPYALPALSDRATALLADVLGHMQAAEEIGGVADVTAYITLMTFITNAARTGEPVAYRPEEDGIYARATRTMLEGVTLPDYGLMRERLVAECESRISAARALGE